MVQAHLKATATANDSPTRKEAKLAVAKGLLERGLGKKEIRRLFRFVDGLLELTDELNIQFMKELAALEAQKDMPCITSIERIGIEKGREEGLQEGREQGRLTMAREIVEQVLEARFGRVPSSIREMIQAVDEVDKLRRLVTHASKAASLEAFASDLKS